MAVQGMACSWHLQPKWQAAKLLDSSMLQLESMLALMAPSRHWKIKWAKGLVNPRVASVPCDLFNLRSLGPTTHAHFFDKAMEEYLLEHNVKVCANTPRLTHILSFKASKGKRFHRIFEKYSFYVVDQMKVVKTGSQEGNTVYIYKRKD
jgi:hypothetical protein